MHKNKQDGQESDGEEDDASNIFLDFIFTFLLDSYDAKDKAVRFRVCQLINKILNNMDDDAIIDDDLADRIFESMLTRLHDKFPAVRVQAVASMSRLQDPTDAECAVISTYLKLMSTDSSAEVRRAVLLNIAISSQTLEGVIGRYRKSLNKHPLKGASLSPICSVTLKGWKTYLHRWDSKIMVQFC